MVTVMLETITILVNISTFFYLNYSQVSLNLSRLMTNVDVSANISEELIIRTC